jgi:stress response protein SCP2
MSINKDILFRRRGAIVAPVREVLSAKAAKVITEADAPYLVVTASQNLSALGYRFSEDLFKSALNSKLSNDELAAYLSETIQFIRKAIGAQRKYKPAYPNFPTQVIEASEFELYFNAVLHYWGMDYPDYKIKNRKPLDEAAFNDLTELRVIGVTKRGLSYKAAVSEFNTIFTSLLSMQSSWGESEIADAGWFVNALSASDFDKLVPDSIPNKENLAALITSVKSAGKTELFEILLSRLATATDVLRVAVGLSDGDAALSGVGVEKTRFVSQPKSVRRLLVHRLETISGGDSDRLIEDMLRNRALWKLLAHSLHVGDFAKSAPTVLSAVSVVRANGKNKDGSHYETFGTKVEALISAAEKTVSANKRTKAAAANVATVNELVALLKTRPGVFARRLDKVLRSSIDKNIVLDAFDIVAPSVATPVLWQLMNFYSNRAFVAGKSPKMSRTFIPKGRASKMMEAKNVLPELDSVLVEGIVERIGSALSAVYRKRDAIGKVFVADELKTYTVPFGARSASKALNPVGRGTRAYIDDSADIIRFFVWWTDGASRTDLDLSAVFLDEDFKVSGQIAYYNLKGDGAVHSGDITSAPNGASEFIDVNRKKLLAQGRRYIGMVVTSYTGQSFDTLPEVFAGVMERQGKGKKGEVYEPRTVHNAFDITAPGKIAMPLIIDLENNSFIWADLAINSQDMYAVNVANNEGALSRSIRGLVESNFVSLHDVFTANAARGELVANRDDADVVIDISRGRVMVNGEVIGTDRILSEWI